MQLRNILVLFLALSSSAFAQGKFFTVTSNDCDGVAIAPLAGQRIYVDLEGSVLGLGYDDENKCRVVDFASVLRQSFSPQKTEFLFVNEAGSKNSCSGKVALPFNEGSRFSSAVVEPTTITLFDTFACKKLVMAVEEAN